MDSKKQGMFDVSQEKIVDGLPLQIMTDMPCKELVETEQPIRRGFKDSFFRQQNERSLAKRTEMDFSRVERSDYRLGGLLVLDDISVSGRTDLHVIRNGNLMAERYANQILRPHVIPYAAAIVDSFHLMQDISNHAAHLVENFLKVQTNGAYGVFSMFS
ncbi:hypothetical protein TNCV_3859631 [Trichonephila clavipes]|nr:hypothetical protein TNCV_3859631 [Trichonephila clavipes]